VVPRILDVLGRPFRRSGLGRIGVWLGHRFSKKRKMVA
jgi:hypothetical protein